MTDERVQDSRDPAQLVLPLNVPPSYYALLTVPLPVYEFLSHLIQPHRHTRPC